jgi:hypothetical protein
MNIFKVILGKIFPADHPANDPASTGVTPPPAVAFAPPVDITAVQTELQANNPQKLNWQTSIVDLLKLVGLDSSLDARKTLASKLGYTGDTNDSATMNIWLHKVVMQKIAENGGKVPDSLK